MPTVQAFIQEGQSEGRKLRLIEDITQAVVESVDAPVDSVRVFISELPNAHFGLAGKPAAEGQAILQAFLIAGRTHEQKSRLIAQLTEAAAAIEVWPESVRVLVQDIPNTDFGLGGKTARALGRGVGRDQM